MLRNEANTAIVNVNISACTNPEWGSNRLNPDEEIAPGETRTWTVAPGCYDVRVSTATRSAFWYDRETEVGDTVRLALSSAADVGTVTPAPGSIK